MRFGYSRLLNSIPSIVLLSTINLSITILSRHNETSFDFSCDQFSKCISSKILFCFHLLPVTPQDFTILALNAIILVFPCLLNFLFIFYNVIHYIMLF